MGQDDVQRVAAIPERLSGELVKIAVGGAVVTIAFMLRDEKWRMFVLLTGAVIVGSGVSTLISAAVTEWK